MKKLLLTFAAVLGVAAFASAADYSVSDSDIDALVSSAVEVSLDASLDVASVAGLGAGSTTTMTASNPNPAVAFILNWFFGYFGVHRHYLGTRPGMWAIYTFTFGGIFGVVPFVDWVVLLIGIIDDDIYQYAGNTKFIMWA